MHVENVAMVLRLDVEKEPVTVDRKAVSQDEENWESKSYTLMRYG